MRQIEITIDKQEQLKRFEQAAWKLGRSFEQPAIAKQVYNVQADSEESADSGLMDASFGRWLWSGIDIISEYMYSEPVFSGDIVTITLRLPQNWIIHSAPGMKYAMLELIHNGMMADWCEKVKPDMAVAFKKDAELNKAQIKSIVYSLNAPM